jgi:predicted  nucleic acid-binding Zn-ribbon protein
MNSVEIKDLLANVITVFQQETANLRSAIESNNVKPQNLHEKIDSNDVKLQNLQDKIKSSSKELREKFKMFSRELKDSLETKISQVKIMVQGGVKTEIDKLNHRIDGENYKLKQQFFARLDTEHSKSFN